MWNQMRLFAAISISVGLMAVPADTADGRPVRPDYHYARVPAEAGGALPQLGLDSCIVTDYGSFLWLKLSPAEHEQL